MISKRKATAMILGLTMGISGTAMAAPNEDADINARIAALEAQQQQLAKQLNALKKENAKLKRTEKIANSNKNAIKGLKEEQNRIQISGFGRVSWDNDNIRGYADQNDNRRTYLELKGKMRVNDKWTFNFGSETNQRYAKFTQPQEDGGNILYHKGHDDEDGVIQRIWAEGKVGVLNVDVGRRWRGLGFQNVLFGNESDGVVLDAAIPKTKLTAKAFHLAPTDKGYHFNITGAGVQGQVGHGLQLQAAYAKLNIGKNEEMGKGYYHVDNTVDATLKNTAGTYGYMLSAMWNPMKNIFLIGDYARTNPAPYDDNYHYDKKDYLALRVNYRWSNLNDPGSFQLYGRWYDYAPNGNGLVGIFGDKEWGLLQPGSHGWIFGFKYIPMKNIEWETCYELSTAQDTYWKNKHNFYHRNFLRTQVDYHF